MPIQMHLIRKILKCFSLTAAMFVFQACYGTNYYMDETNMAFRVVSEKTGEPIPGVKVETQLVDSTGDNALSNWALCCYTDSLGIAEVYTIVGEESSTTKFRFTDTNAVYSVKDTIVDDLAGTIEIVLSPARNAR